MRKKMKMEKKSKRKRIREPSERSIQTRSPSTHTRSGAGNNYGQVCSARERCGQGLVKELGSRCGQGHGRGQGSRGWLAGWLGEGRGVGGPGGAGYLAGGGVRVGATSCWFMTPAVPVPLTSLQLPHLCHS